MKRFTLILSLLFSSMLMAQNVQSFKQHNMKRWGIPAGNYSGITQIEGDRYALVSDKQKADGWSEVDISFLPSGDLDNMQFISQNYNNQTLGNIRDAEGITYIPGKGFYVGAENDQQLLELSEKGKPTGVGLSVPSSFAPTNIFSNYGFESLTYDKEKEIFWTTTEQGLKSDVPAPSSPENRTPTLLRLQSFDCNLKPLRQYAYKTDVPKSKHRGRHYAFGVSEMLVVNDTTLLVMERELNIPQRYNRSCCNIRIYSVNPEQHHPITDTTIPLSKMDSTVFLPKKLVCSFSTGFRLFGKKNLANYEGMCLGPKLENGSQTVLLVSDSQNRAGKALFHLKDYIRVVKFSP